MRHSIIAILEITIYRPERRVGHMDPSCPKCSKQLPEVETLKYRFCPHCGAEIPAEAGELDNAFLTRPPDLSKRQPKRPPRHFESAHRRKWFHDEILQ